jgi:hypothetical protein
VKAKPKRSRSEAEAKLVEGKGFPAPANRPVNERVKFCELPRKIEDRPKVGSDVLWRAVEGHAQHVARVLPGEILSQARRRRVGQRPMAHPPRPEIRALQRHHDGIILKDRIIAQEMRTTMGG